MDTAQGSITSTDFAIWVSAGNDSMGDPGAASRTACELRPRLVRKIIKRVQAGGSILVVGGPGMGKTHLLQSVSRSVAVKCLDNSAPDQLLEELKASNGPIIASFGVEHYARVSGLRNECLWVPLTNLTQSHLTTALEPISWQWSVGHPTLAFATNRARSATVLSVLQPRWRDLLANRRTAYNVLHDLVELPDDIRPAESYIRLRSRHGAALKKDLDWLSCAGLINRFIDGDSAGVLAVPGVSAAL